MGPQRRHVYPRLGVWRQVDLQRLPDHHTDAPPHNCHHCTDARSPHSRTYGLPHSSTSYCCSFVIAYRCPFVIAYHVPFVIAYHVPFVIAYHVPFVIAYQLSHSTTSHTFSHCLAKQQP